jgi:hypothetical protein
MPKKGTPSSNAGRGELRVALIGAVAVLLAAVIGGLLARGHTAASSSFHEDLQVLDVTVIDRPPHAAMQQTYDAATAAGVVVTLRNPGNGISVITRARFVVERFARLSATDDCIPGAGPVPISANYQVSLSPVAHTGQAFAARLSQQVAANSADRFQIGFAQYQTTQYAEAYLNGYGTGNSSIYQLRVELFHDGARKPLQAGTIILALPFPWSGLFPGGQGPGFSCAAMPQNVRTLRRMLALRGARSSTLAAFGRDPAINACAEQERGNYCDARTRRRSGGSTSPGG